MHLVGFDASAETIELRLTARDRSGYATGALAAADWLLATNRAPGIHSFDEVVDDLLTARAPAAASQPVVSAA
jgi:4-hydroxy-tetrahydrodipicolinate reductase